MKKYSFKINTASGRMVDLSAPFPETISLYDISRALAKLCRFTGHTEVFYSVAQHCLFCAHQAKLMGYGVDVQLWALLHDAHEAYCNDLNSPLKNLLGTIESGGIGSSAYREIERGLQCAIIRSLKLDAKKFPSEEADKAVHEIDMAALTWEARFAVGLTQSSLKERGFYPELLQKLHGIDTTPWGFQRDHGDRPWREIAILYKDKATQLVLELRKGVGSGLFLADALSSEG